MFVFKNYMNRILSQKVRINFFNSSSLMAYQRAILSKLCLTKDKNLLKLVDRNHEQIWKFKNSVRVIESFFFRRKVRRSVLMRRCSPAKMILIQKIVRGFLVRKRNKQLIHRFKMGALRKSKGYVKA